MRIETVGIIGGGAWGTALALVASRAGHGVTIFVRDESTRAAMNASSASPTHIGAAPNPIMATDDLRDVAKADMVIIAVPSQAVRNAASLIGPATTEGQPVVVAAKGIELGTGKRMSEVVAETIPGAEIAVLSGPSFAADVAKNLPTAVTLAASREDLALELCRALNGPAFRPYAETDIVGVELGGALKNVLAIAAGIVAGRGLGASAGAALVARGFAEMRRFAEAFGARPETLMGLSGLGDTILTCSSPQSRNYSVGLAIGAGRSVPKLLAEGMATAEITSRVAAERGISMPVTATVATLLVGAVSVDAAVEALMNRPLKPEIA